MEGADEATPPKTLKEYQRWLETSFECRSFDVLNAYYETVATKALADTLSSNIWRRILEGLSSINANYQAKTGFRLLLNNEQPELVKKPFNSIFHKTFRKNIITNKNWPNSPEGGWYEPSAWHTKINDLIRTTIIVKYLDGVTFLSDALGLICEQEGISWRADYEAREEGYYARHFYLDVPVEVPLLEWDTERCNVRLEVQVATQLQDVIRRLTHKHYEQRREQLVKPDLKWQWDYASPEFKSNYLGHILHYVEGMIMEIREA